MSIGNTTWHILPEGSESINDAIGRVEVSKDEIVRLLNQAMREIVQARIEEHGIEALVFGQVERRVEVAVKSMAQNIDRRVHEAAASAISKRVAEVVSGLRISVNVTIENP